MAYKALFLPDFEMPSNSRAYLLSEHKWHCRIRGSRRGKTELQHIRTGGSCTRCLNSLAPHGSDAVTAVVIGGGIAGLAAAQAVSSVCDRVIVLERDSGPCASSRTDTLSAINARRFRVGVPQYKQPHALLAQGLHDLETLFPGYTQAVQDQGACLAQQVGSVRRIHPIHGPLQTFPSSGQPIPHLLSSRHVYEQTAKELLTQNEKVQFCYGCSVKDLVVDQSQRAVRGVILKDGRQVTGDLVVDASGRRSTVLECLQAAGLIPEPPRSVVDAMVAYTSRRVKLSREARQKLQPNIGVFVLPNPASPRSFLLAPESLDHYFTIYGTFNDRKAAPRDPEALLEGLRSMSDPLAYEVMKDAEGLTPLMQYQETGNVRRHVERLDMPAGVAMLGDAVCSLNPTYGQGMTVAVMQARALGEMLRERCRHAQTPQAKRAVINANFSKAWHRRAARIVDPCWWLTATADARFPNCKTNVKPSLGGTLFALYLAQVVHLARTDATAQDAYLRFQHRTVDFPALLQPAIMVKVVYGLAVLLVGEVWKRLLLGLRRPSAAGAVVR